MRIYVIGPVTGHVDLNRPTFESARAKLSAAGHEAVIPHDFIHADASHARAMRMSLCWMLFTGRVEGVALLDGWNASPGALLERAVAAQCGIACGSVDEWARVAPGKEES